jgi:F-type H+-transporting ATPase subunit b
MEGLLDGLGINLPLLISFVINFFVLFILLSVVLYKPVLKMLDERQAKIKESMEQAEQIKEQTLKAEENIKEQLETARKEGQKIVSQAEQIGERLKAEAKEEAQKQAESLINKASIEIQRQRDKDLEDLRKQFADIAILAAEKVIEESLDKKKHQKIIDEILKDSEAFKKG